MSVVTGRVAPWDVAIGDQVECFARDAFGPPGHLHRRRIALRWLHDQEEVGVATRSWDDRTGLFAAFRLHPGNLGEHALSMIRDGVRGLSVSFGPLESVIRLDGVKEIRRAWLDHVGLCTDPAHAEATILWPGRDHPHTEPPEVTEARVEALDHKLRRPAERRRLERIGIALR